MMTGLLVTVFTACYAPDASAHILWVAIFLRSLQYAVCTITLLAGFVFFSSFPSLL